LDKSAGLADLLFPREAGRRPHPVKPPARLPASRTITSGRSRKARGRGQGAAGCAGRATGDSGTP